LVEIESVKFLSLKLYFNNMVKLTKEFTLINEIVSDSLEPLFYLYSHVRGVEVSILG
jgi:hypothetical protein